MSAAGRGVWALADPKISLASFASLGLGLAAAATDGPVAWGWFAVTVAGIFAVEVAKNASGEVVDWDRGVDQRVTDADRSPFSGGKRVLVDGLLTRGQTIAVAGVAYLAAVLIGLVILRWREPAAWWLAGTGVLLAFFYHAPPVMLSYRGLGELAVGVCYGPLLCGGTYLVQRGGPVPAWVWWLGAPLGLLIAAFLWINEFPDYEADRASGKGTLVVRLGRRRASRVFVGLIGVAALLAGLLPLGVVPRGALFGLVAMPSAITAARTLAAWPEETARLVPAQARALMAFVLYALGAGVGMTIGR